MHILKVIDTKRLAIFETAVGETAVGEQVIPVMKLQDCYEHLGVLIGQDPNVCLDRLGAEFREDTEKLFYSVLWLTE